MSASDTTIEMRRLLRDADGFVHTPRGYIAGEGYDHMRDAHPEQHYPRREDIPLMSDLADDDLKRWYETDRTGAQSASRERVRAPRRA
jgi:hypothetical protein